MISPVVRALCLSLVVLAGCAAPGGLRDPKAPISSTTRMKPARFAGPWHVVARLARPGDPGANLPESFEFSPAGGGFSVHHRVGTCTDAACVFQAEDTPARISGPGRLRLELRGEEAELWLLWIDADHRTAVVGTPEGTFGWIMEKGGKPTPPDRMAAAREILDWAGYDLSRLQEVSQ